MGFFGIFRKKTYADNEDQTVSVPTPNDEKENTLSACVDRLLSLYQQKTTGFYEGEAGEVRKVGEELNHAGGMELMLQAYNAFAKRRPECARNLESSWSGIGEWMG